RVRLPERIDDSQDSDGLVHTVSCGPRFAQAWQQVANPQSANRNQLVEYPENIWQARWPRSAASTARASPPSSPSRAFQADQREAQMKPISPISPTRPSCPSTSSTRLCAT